MPHSDESIVAADPTEIDLVTGLDRDQSEIRDRPPRLSITMVPHCPRPRCARWCEHRRSTFVWSNFLLAPNWPWRREAGGAPQGGGVMSLGPAWVYSPSGDDDFCQELCQR